MVTTTIKAAIGLQKETDEGVEKQGIALHDGLNGNTHYPAPPVDLATFKTAIDAFSAAIVAARDGGKKAIAEKKKQREIVIRMIHTLAHFVEANCKDDMAIFLSSGLKPISKSRTKQPVPPPRIDSVKQGNSGQLILSTKSIRNAHSFQVRYAPLSANGTPGTWITADFTNGRFMVINGLTRGTDYTFQVRALGSLGPSDWSDFATHMCI